MFKRIGIKNITLVTLSFIVVTIIIVMGGYFAYQLQEEKIIENRYNELAAIKDLKVNQILNWRSERIGDARSIVNNPMISNGLKSLSKNRDEKVKKIITNWLQLVKQSYKYDQMVILDKNKNLIAATEETEDKELEHLKTYDFYETDSVVTISDLHKDHKNRVHLSIRLIFKDDDGIYSFLIIQMDPHVFLFPLIQYWPGPSKSAETLLFREEADSVLYLSELRYKSNTALNYRLPIVENSKSVTVNAVQGKTGLFRGTDYRGEKVLSDIGQVPGTDWFIVAKIDESEIFGELQRSLISSIIIVILLLALGYLVILKIWRKSKIESIEKELELQKDKLRLSNLYATLSQINQAIVREQSKAELILTISRLPVKFGNFKASAICLLEENTGKLKIESFAGTLDYFNKILTDASEFNHEDPSAQAVKEGKTIIDNNIEDTKSGWQSVALKTGIKSCAASPIKPFDKTVGSFVLYSEEENFFQLPEIRLIEEIASDISFSLETIEKNERRKKAEKQIEESERRLATLFTNLPGIAYRCKYNSDWTMEFMSEGTLNVTGYLPEEIVEQKVITYEQIIYPNDRELVQRTIDEAVKNKKSFTIVYRIVTKQNEIKWVWERGLPIYVSDKVLVLEGLITDITETKEAQDQLQKSEEYFRYLFHSNPLPMWIYDLESFKFLEVNIAAINKYKYTSEEFQNMTLFDIRPVEDHDRLATDLNTQRAEKAESSEWRHKLKSGEIIDVLIISHKIEFDKKPAVLVVAIDITDRKKAAQTLKEAKEKAEAGEQLKSDFLAQMSHEIRTPVNVILSFSSIIKDAVYSKLDPDLREGFSAIDNAGKRLTRTIDSILNMAQITRGMFELQPETLDIYSAIILPLKNEFEHFAAAKNLKFIIEKNCESTIVPCDRYSVSQIFANLIDNAIKYTGAGYVKVSINCTEDNISVSVIDSGIGIAEEFLPRLFMPFSQEETGYSRAYEGTGLGLALVKNYCDMNNATISVESNKGKGTTFKVTLNKYSE